MRSLTPLFQALNNVLKKEDHLVNLDKVSGAADGVNFEVDY